MIEEELKKKCVNFTSVSKTVVFCQSEVDSSLCENTVKRKQKHNEEARGEKVPQSRDGHGEHAPITAGDISVWTKEGWWGSRVLQIGYV